MGGLFHRTRPRKHSYRQGVQHLEMDQSEPWARVCCPFLLILVARNSRLRWPLLIALGGHALATAMLFLVRACFQSPPTWAVGLQAPVSRSRGACAKLQVARCTKLEPYDRSARVFCRSRLTSELRSAAMLRRQGP